MKEMRERNGGEVGGRRGDGEVGETKGGDGGG